MAVPAAGGTVLEQPVRQDLSVEDVAPGKPKTSLEVGWPQHQAILHQVGEPGGIALERPAYCANTDSV